MCEEPRSPTGFFRECFNNFPRHPFREILLGPTVLGLGAGNVPSRRAAVSALGRGHAEGHRGDAGSRWVFGEKQPPGLPRGETPGRRLYLLCSLLQKSATAQWEA